MKTGHHLTSKRVGGRKTVETFMFYLPLFLRHYVMSASKFKMFIRNDLLFISQTITDYCWMRINDPLGEFMLCSLSQQVSDS